MIESTANSIRFPHAGLAILMVAAVCVALAGCGRKGPPVAPVAPAEQAAAAEVV